MRLQIIMQKKTDRKIAAENEVRYARMTGIYNGAGFEAYFSYAANINDLETIIRENQPDLVLCGIDHLPEEKDGIIVSTNVHGWFESHNVLYIGSDPEAIERALSKASLKRKWEADGIRTAPFVHVEAGEASLKEGIQKLMVLDAFPYIIKPENLGNSKGIDENSIAWNVDELSRILARMILLYGGHILVEHYLGAYPDVKEITCVMIQGQGAMQCMPAFLGLAQPKRFHLITSHDKDGHHTVMSPLEPEQMEHFVRFAQSAFESAGVRDYARGDFFFADGKFWAIEINGQPMIPDRWFEEAAGFAGISEAQYLVGIVAAGYRRLRAQGKLTSAFPAGARALLEGTRLAEDSSAETPYKGGLQDV